MKKTTFIILLISFLTTIHFNVIAQDSISYNYYCINEWLFIKPVEMCKPLMNKGADYSGKAFNHADFFDMTPLPSDDFRPSEGRFYCKTSNSQVWNKKISTKSGYFNYVFDNNEIVSENEYFISVLAGYLEAKKYQEIELKASSPSPFQVFLDGNLVLNNNDFDKNDKVSSKKIKVEMGKHTIFVKTLYQKNNENNWYFKLENGTKEGGNIEWTLDPSRKMDIDIVQNGIRLKDASISPSGRYVKYSYSCTSKPDGKTENWKEIYKVSDKSLVFSTRFNGIYSFDWHPTDDAILFKNKQNGKDYIFKQSLETNIIEPVMVATEDMNFYQVNDKYTFIIYGVSVSGKKNADGVNRLDGMEDRWPWHRYQTKIYKYDIKSGTHSQLTACEQVCNLEAIHPNEDKIIVSQSISDYSERPYTRQIMMEIDLQNGNIDTLWNQNFGGSVKYSPDGKQLLVIGSAMMFNGLGRNLPKKMIANDYDKQAYIFNISEKTAKTITKYFDPSIESAEWCRNDGLIYFKVEEKTYHNVYVYNIENESFTSIPTQIDNVMGMTKSANSSLLSYFGCSIQEPEQGFVIDVTSNDVVMQESPESQIFNDVQFGDVQDYTFKAKDGNIIDGYFYLPPDFDSSRKYPMIVYYYGGTSPVDRSFRGRYPKNYYAANGYVVYVLNPAGTTGYGQKYAAEHVNNWGITVADEIIEGVKRFTKDHSFVDAEHIGCMGASYGGFMTELLMTRTDIFAAAISHAGISSISSYWGEGYWGYLYNSVAAAETFPWNNKEMYVGQSALFNADKINTPLLLLHGTADTNVPEGESIQLYTALKLLGKECELIEVQGQDHHIKDYKKFNKWQKSIMAWWDKWLKNDNTWWNDLY